MQKFETLRQPLLWFWWESSNFYELGPHLRQWKYNYIIQIKFELNALETNQEFSKYDLQQAH